MQTPKVPRPNIDSLDRFNVYKCLPTVWGKLHFLAVSYYRVTAMPLAIYFCVSVKHSRRLQLELCVSREVCCGQRLDIPSWPRARLLDIGSPNGRYLLLCNSIISRIIFYKMIIIFIIIIT